MLASSFVCSESAQSNVHPGLSLLISLLEMWLIKNIKNLCFFSSLVYRQGE
jgi:hypothetical protein